MAYDTYASLKSTVADMMARSDLTSSLDLFVTQATNFLNRRIRLREMETIATLTPVDGVVTLPTDYLQYRRVVDLGSPRTEVSYMAPTAVDQAYQTSYAGKAIHFTIIGTSLYTRPLTANNVELTYYAKLPHLSDAQTTNALLTAHPDVYLRASLAFGFDFIRDDAQMQKHMAIADALIDEATTNDRIANYAKAGTWIKGVTP